MQDSVENNKSDLRSNSAPDECETVYTTKPFKFIVEGTEFHVHAALISRHSKPLDRMINGEMSEAMNGVAVLEEVEKGTFARFAEWAYQGYYTAAKIKSRFPDHSGSGKSLTANASAEKNEVSQGHKDLHYRSKKALQLDSTKNNILDYNSNNYMDSKASRTQLKESFINRKPIVRQDSIRIPPPRPNKEPDEDYTDVFLSHAQVYVFAEKYDIPKLKALALENLQNVLAIFDLMKTCTGDIVALLQYIYENTSERNDGNEDMRTLLTHYIGYEMETLIEDEEFKDVMIADGGEMLNDFMKAVQQRIK